MDMLESILLILHWGQDEGNIMGIDKKEGCCQGMFVPKAKSLWNHSAILW